MKENKSELKCHPFYNYLRASAKEKKERNEMKTTAKANKVNNLKLVKVKYLSYNQYIYIFCEELITYAIYFIFRRLKLQLKNDK